MHFTPAALGSSLRTTPNNHVSYLDETQARATLRMNARASWMVMVRFGLPGVPRACRASDPLTDGRFAETVKALYSDSGAHLVWFPSARITSKILYRVTQSPGPPPSSFSTSRMFGSRRATAK